jgi:transposase-like protein
MGRQRFTPEFKEGAVRQVIERDHSVVDVAVRLGGVSPEAFETASKSNL